MLIMLSLYTANTSATFTTSQLRSIIRGRDDLKGKKVVTWVEYTKVLSAYGITAIGMLWVSCGCSVAPDE